MIDMFMSDAMAPLSGTNTSVTLMWTTTDAVAVRLEIEPNAGPGSRTIRGLPMEETEYPVLDVNSTTTFTLVVTGEDGLETSDEETVMVTDEQAVIDRFVATPNSVMTNEDVTLRWETTNTTVEMGVNVSITDGTDDVPDTDRGEDGMATVSPAATTTYTLTATGKNTVPASESVTVTVTAMPTATSILSFTAEPASITDGQTVTLRVMAANASSASINSINQNVGDVPLSPDGSGNFIGSVEVTPSVDTEYTLTVTGTPTVTATATVTVTPSPPAVITSFTASPNPSPYGGDVTLRWTVTNPGSVDIMASSGGATPTTVTIPPDQMPANGMVTVNPIANTTYTLTATAAGADMRDVFSQVTVVVDPPLEPAIGSFSGTTPIAEGGMAILSWTTTNAESVAITGGTGTTVPIPGDQMPASGMVEVMPDVGMTTYTLTATGAPTTTMPATETTTVTVNRAPPAEITSFAGPAGSVAFGSDVALRWTTTNAEMVAITADPADPDQGGTVTIPADQMAASGLVTVNPTADTTYTLTAMGGGGMPLNATMSVVVTVAAERIPVIDSFTATPEVGPINQNVTLVWTTTNARSVTLTAGDEEVPGATAANGSVSVRPTVGTTYVLTAIGIDDPDNTVMSAPIMFVITSTGLRSLVER